MYGHFTAHHLEDKYKFRVEISLNDIRALQKVVHNIRRIFDLDSDLQRIETDLAALESAQLKLSSGLRLPGIWNLFEAGVRAILGQQISIGAARKLVTTLVKNLGEERDGYRYFPTPQSVAHGNLDFLRMPNTRKETLRRLSEHFLNSGGTDDPTQWKSIKGVGLWTIQYAQMRGLSHPDIELSSDAGIKKALEKVMTMEEYNQASPWRSYLTLQLWDTLH